MSIATNPTAGRERSGEQSILICEDNHLIARGCAMLLARAGYTVIGPAHSAEEALEMAYRHRPSLALLDIGLGGVLDGISVAAELAPLGVAVIFITADYRRAASEGREYAAEILIKPVRVGTVLASVASVLQNSQGTKSDGAAAV